MTARETVTETMLADNDTLVVTDPCYLLAKEHWEHFCNLCFDEKYEKTKKVSITISEYLRKYHNFGEVVGGDTGYGDWSNAVKTETGRIIGNFVADAGMVICCTVSDLVNYNPSIMSTINELERVGSLAVIPDYTGEVIYELEDRGGLSDWAMITFPDCNYSTLLPYWLREEEDEE